MKKFFLSAAVIVSFIGYALRGHFKGLGEDDNHVIPTPNLNTHAVPTQTDNTNSTTNTSDTTNTSNVPVNSTPTPTPTPVTTGTYKNGTYTGTAADAFYGLVQVQAKISGGKISDIKPLQYPNDRDNSIRISGYSLPMLIQEAIQAQTAEVDVVSGATDTSIAFRQSLQSALNQAQ